MNTMASVLFCALVVACLLAALFLSVACTFAAQRNEAKARVKQLEREATKLQGENVNLRRRLSRRPKSAVVA